MADKSNVKIFKRVLSQLGGYKYLLLLTLFLALITVAGNLAVPIIFGDIIESLSQGAVNFAQIGVRFAIIGSIVLITALCQWLMSVINNQVTFRTVKDVREQAFAHLQRLPLKYIDGHSYGDIVSRNIADVEHFADGLLLGFTQLFTGVLTILGTLVLMAIFHWIIAIVVVVVTPLSLFVAKFIASKTYTMFKKTSEARGEQTAFIEEMIGGLKVVKAFNREDENAEKFDKINEKLTKTALQSTFFSSLTNPSTRFVNCIVYALVALSGALSLIFPAAFASLLPVAFNVGRLTTLLSYANQYTKPFNEISEVITELQNAVACAGRIYELIDEQPQSPDGAIVMGEAEGNVVFDNVSFSYAPEQKLIQNFNVSVQAGKRIAIVGPTGCGKTTLINLLMRFYDVNSGKITVDENDINDLTRKSLRQNYGMVLQETWLKNGTIRDNIVIGKPDATDEEVIAAAKAAHAHGFIKQLKDGYQTQIGEDGGALSQGQKQLLCITRIMLCLPPMLILDEATSSIDTRTEIKIQQAFAQMMQGRTSFVVAHRLSTIKHSDFILVMKDGNIVEQGTHTQLLAQKGFYSQLYYSQFAI